MLTWTRSLPLTRPCGLRLRRIPIAASQAAIVSRREKESPLFHFLKLVSMQAAFSGGFARTLGAFLPLPEGDGRGEGGNSRKTATSNKKWYYSLSEIFGRYSPANSRFHHAPVARRSARSVNR